MVLQTQAHPVSLFLTKWTHQVSDFRELGIKVSRSASYLPVPSSAWLRSSWFPLTINVQFYEGDLPPFYLLSQFCEGRLQFFDTDTFDNLKKPKGVSATVLKVTSEVTEQTSYWLFSWRNHRRKRKLCTNPLHPILQSTWIHWRIFLPNSWCIFPFCSFSYGIFWNASKNNLCPLNPLHELWLHNSTEAILILKL